MHATHSSLSSGSACYVCDTQTVSPCICLCLCQSWSLSLVTVGWRGWYLPLMTSCRLTWLLGRLCRVSGGMSSRQPGGSSGSSSAPDWPGSPSSPGSGLWGKVLVKALA